ncbi:DHH family phosphoesterase [Paenibacillus sp. MMS18-CY102]|uniref:DHH family phosphoesterase n=1 Tax=Paenibacillus sp. MMS18-CY102 TaxID=2682849 RepID=UPI001366230B|nr:bifunctional oligoribonuclease/PAP phosphatase NrnA [Paenibacillus sp. MMS18-CY102]MWC26521.1 bifunctional oligoribonuclease/PAP phosphatase NrnA [Paenibacillus sp. MMS18-CY102]
MSGSTVYVPIADLLEQALAFMREGDDFLVVSHVQPDGDAISSTVVIGWLLGKLGKRYTLINEGASPSRLHYLHQSNTIVNYSLNKPERTYQRIIAVDCADFRRIGDVASCFAEGYELLNIDHHPTNDLFGSVNLVLPFAAATVEILYELLEQAAIQLDEPVATAIYTGLLTDTGGFRYSNTTPRVMEIASHLLQLGVSGHWIADYLLERMTMPQLKLLQLALNRLSFSQDATIGWLYIEATDLADTGAAPEDLEGLVNYARNVDGVEVGILFKEMLNGSVKVSLRSAGRADVAAIAQSFGGGGHVRAAGCRLDTPMVESIELVVEAVRKALSS